MEALTVAKAAFLLKQKVEGYLAPELSEAWQRATEDSLQVLYATAFGVVGAAKGREPTSKEVQAFMVETIGDRRFPARVYRLLNEAAASSSSERRRRLAVVLLGGPKAVPTPSDLERVDASVVRLTDQDVALRAVLVDATTRLRTKDGLYPNASTNDLQRRRGYLGRPAHTALTRLPIGVTALAINSLQSAGCLTRERGFHALLTDSVAGPHHRTTVPVGREWHSITDLTRRNVG